MRPGFHALVVSGGELEQGEPIAALIELARVARADAVELWYPKNFALEDVHGVAGALARAGLTAACVSTPTELCRLGGNAGDVQLLHDAIEVAGAIGAPLVNTYFGARERRDDAEAIVAYAAALGPCLDSARAEGVTIVLENEFDVFGADPCKSDITRRPNSLARLVDTVASEHFRVTFDPLNFYFADADPLVALDRLAPLIAYVHVKNGRRLLPGESTSKPWRAFDDHGRRYTTCRLDDGAVQWPVLLDRLADYGYRGALCLEPHCERDALASACVSAADYIREIAYVSREMV